MSSVYINIPNSIDLNFKRKIEFAILKEINLRHDELQEDLLQSIYIKSLDNEHLSPIFLKDLIFRLNSYYSFDNKIEITLELDFETIKNQNLLEISKTKVNRLSFRTYSSLYKNLINEKSNNYFFEKLSLAPKFFRNFSIDLIFGVPNLSNETLDKLLDKINENEPAHITLEEYNNGLNNVTYKGKYFNKNLVLDQYNLYCEKLLEYGFEQYEYLNFSKNGNYSKQNLNYWNRRPYLGFGPSACSYFNESRSVNYSDSSEYIIQINKSKKPLKIEWLSEKDVYNETIMTGFSISEGLSSSEIRKKFKSFDSFFQRKLKKHIGLGNLYLEKKFIKVNQQNKYFTDLIASDFFKI